MIDSFARLVLAWPTNSADVYLDPDGDGLINLHEYWADCDPMTPDGSNTLLSVCARSVDDRIANSVVVESKHKFVNYIANGQNRMFVTNANFWAGDVDTSCASMWNSHSGQYRPGTLVSKRHMLFANHYFISIGTIVWFVGTDGNAYSNRVVDAVRISDTDISIALLEYETPTNVVPAKILPPDFGDYLSIGVGLPVLEFDHSENGHVYEIRNDLSSTVIRYRELIGSQTYYEYSEMSASTTIPKSALRYNYYKPVVVGDSGNPVFLICGNDTVFLGAAHSRTAIGMDGDYGSNSPFATLYATRIQSAMDELCPGYGLEFYDLSTFEKLPECRRIP